MVPRCIPLTRYGHTHTRWQMKCVRANDTWQQDLKRSKCDLRLLVWRPHWTEHRGHRHSSAVYSSSGVKSFDEKEAPSASRSGVTARTQHKGRFRRCHRESKMRKIAHKFWHCSLASAVLRLRGWLEYPCQHDNSKEANTTGLSNALILLHSVRLVPFTSANIYATISDNAKVSAVHSNSKVTMQHNLDQPHRMVYTKTGRTDLKHFCRHSNHERKVEQLSVTPKTMDLSLKHHCIAWRRDIPKSLATATFLSNKTARCHNTDNNQSFLLRWRQRRWAALFFLSKKEIGLETLFTGSIRTTATTSKTLHHILERDGSYHLTRTIQTWRFYVAQQKDLSLRLWYAPPLH